MLFTDADARPDGPSRTDVLNVYLPKSLRLSVLLSGYACYCTVPWLVSRPPRLLLGGAAPPPTSIASLNVRLLSHVSHQLITFPSGHVAVSTAAALSVFSVWAPAGIVIGIVAVGIAAGAVIGGYHFRVDVLAGAAVGIAAAVCGRL